MSNIDVIKRFFDERADVDQNAQLLSQYIEFQRDIDAVVLKDTIDERNVNNVNMLLESSDMSYCLLNINNHLVLIYPNEQRELFMNMQNELSFGDDIVQYEGFSYSESLAMKDFLNAANIKYIASTDNEGRIKFMASKQDEAALDKAMSNIQDEIPGNENYFKSKNICWAHTINQASNVINYDGGPVFVGREGGTGGIKLDTDGAIVMTTKGSRFISRMSKDFDRKVVNAMLNDIDGAGAPVKVFYGDIVDLIAGDMTRRGVKENAKVMPKKQALEVLNLDTMPDFDGMDELFNNSDDYTPEQQSACYSLSRMVICREMRLDDIEEYRVSKADKQRYMQEHTQNVELFAEEFGNIKIARSKEESR